MAHEQDVQDGRRAARGPRFTYPLMLDVTDLPVVIVGGGAVAVRKARGLVAAGATRIRCVAPDVAPEMPDRVRRVAERYEPRHLDGAALVFAATDSPQVNAAVAGEARRRGVLVCRADDDGDDAPGDFASPASFREGLLCVAVSAGGSPAVAALVRDALRERLDPRWPLLAEASASLRPVLLRSRLGPEDRRAALRDLASDEAMAVLSTGAVSGLFDWLCAKYPALVTDP